MQNERETVPFCMLVQNEKQVTSWKTLPDLERPMPLVLAEQSVFKTKDFASLRQ